jgi:predicted helicase
VAGAPPIYYHDVGDFLTREQKLHKVTAMGSIRAMQKRGELSAISPDTHGDWLRKRDSDFDQLTALGDKSSGSASIVDSYSAGVKTNRDAWCYNFSERVLGQNMERMVRTYNENTERVRFLPAESREAALDTTPNLISWSWVLRGRAAKGEAGRFERRNIGVSLYRPFTKSYLYYDKMFNENRYRMPSLFPTAGAANLVIGVSGGTNRGEFSALMCDCVPSLHAADMNGAQYFPRWIFDHGQAEDGLFGRGDGGPGHRDAITDAGLKQFTDAYPGQTISKDDLFYFVYGVLHSPDYRARYADNLRRQLPRMPILKRAEDFWAFVEAGRKLGDLHVKYEFVEPYPVSIGEGDLRLANIDYPVAYFRVEKMKFAGKRPKLDKTTVIYNPRITITNIPLAAYEYVVNGKPALEWVMERQCVSTDPASGIVNDANLYANETVGDPRYPFDLFRRIITVSLETMKIVKGLPALDIREAGAD